ncbi:hypothetical protein PR202_gb19273 [Eleusine coracana subsp. coracana]|uniref:FAR1 domain-containing protein n=1 Tax=Eleusine coracana subsp. coracana TaxID=191504 RepID=A0AAV5F7T7_ELECO|nr:hypothetical protein PR202_gb19273 [Eleusine coracana subsp. coracana]
MHDREKEKIIGHEDDTELTPYEGMEFESEDAARDFYSTYARSTGFQIRISRYTRSRRDNSIISRRIVCSKEGFCETRPCDGLHSDQKQERAGTRVGCKAMIMIKKFGPGKWIVAKFIKKHNHGPVSPRKLDARPANQDGDPMGKTHSLKVDPAKEPFEGMEFESEEAAKSFYVDYARLNGFRARISRYCRSRRDNSIISRQIVCSKEGFREVRTKKVMTDEGKTKRPRMITRVGCKAMIVVKKMNSGKWMVSKFEKEHNHSLSYSKTDPSTSNITAGEVDHFDARIIDPNEVKTEGYNAGTHCNSTDSLTVLYNNLCQEAIKFAKEGSVTEEVYHVAVSALKEAAHKVAEVKRSRPTLPRSDCISERKQELLHMKPITALQSANDVGLKKPAPGAKPFQEPNSNLVFIPTNVLTDSRLSNYVNNVPQPRDLLINGGQCKREPKRCLHFGNIKEASSRKPQMQNTNSDQAIQGKDKGILRSSEETMVAIPAIPLALCMPMTRNLHGASADGPYGLLAAPIEAVPISYCPAEPIRQPRRSIRDLGPVGVFSDLNNKRIGPNPLVHATALACGARIVPLEEAASLVKAVESKIRSGGAIITKMASSNLASLVPPVTMPSSSEDEESGCSELLMVEAEHSCHDQNSNAMKQQSELSD